MKLWAVFLFCGVLVPSWAVLENPSVIANLGGSVIQKFMQDLVGKVDLLEEVSGAELGALGSVLGGVERLLPETRGLLNTVQGLTGLKIVHITPPKVSIKVLPGPGIELTLYTKVSIGDGKRGSDEKPLLQVEVNITTVIAVQADGKNGLKLVVKECQTHVGNVQAISSLVHLEKVLMNALIKILPKVLCPVIDTAVSLANIVIRIVDTVAPVGKLGHIHYLVNGLPPVDGQHLQLDLNAFVTDAVGNVIAPWMGPGVPMSLPPVSDHTSQVVVSESLLDSVFALLYSTGHLDMDIADHVDNTLVPLTTDAIKPHIPEVSHLIPDHLPLVVRFRFASPPKVTLHEGKAILNVTVSIEVLIRHKNSTLKPLFTVDGNIVLSLGLSVKDHKLHFDFDVERVQFWLASSHFGPFDISDLENWLRRIIGSLHLPKLRTALKDGIPLPKLFNMDLTDAAVDIADHAAVLTKTV